MEGSAELELVKAKTEPTDAELRELVIAQTAEVQRLIELHDNLTGRARVIIEEIEARGVSQLMSEIAGSMFKRRKRRGEKTEDE